MLLRCCLWKRFADYAASSSHAKARTGLGAVRSKRKYPEASHHPCVKRAASDSTASIEVCAQEQATRKAGNEPVLPVPMTSELGDVSPIFVVPGVWSDAALRRYARQVTESLLFNCGFNCLSPQVVVLAAEWPQVRGDPLQAPHPSRPSRHAACWQTQVGVCQPRSAVFRLRQ
jgi:hypothetical protein